jgi:hypothetical protein
MLHVVRIHGPNLVPGGSAKNLDDFHQLVDSRFTREKRLSKHQLGHDAPCGPDIYKQGGVSDIYFGLNGDLAVLPIFVV